MITRVQHYDTMNNIHGQFKDIQLMGSEERSKGGILNCNTSLVKHETYLQKS